MAELRRTDQPAVADLLVKAALGATTSSEILGDVGVVLRNNRKLRSRLSDSAGKGWDAVMADVNRAFPGSAVTYWIARLKDRLGIKPKIGL